MEFKDNENLLKWDGYFYKVCKTAAENSSCLSRQIGAVLVEDKTALCSGYNGPPRGISHCGERYKKDPILREYMINQGFDPDDEDCPTMCPRYKMEYKSGEGLEWCVAGHAERNVLINAARHGISTKGKYLYMDCGVPCTPCLVEIINAGIFEIVVSKLSFYDRSALYLLRESNLNVRIYSHLCTHDDLLKLNEINHQGEDAFCSDCGMQIGDIK